MKWELNRRTMQMEPKKETGIRVSTRQGGIMVEDHDKNIQFLINYSDNRITHCVGIQPTNLHVFDNLKSRQIADKVMRLGAGRNIDKIYFDWKTYSINNRNNMKNNEHHIYRLEEYNEFINEAHSASDPYVDLPVKVEIPYKHPWTPKEVVKKAKEDYKEYVKTAQKINGDNLEILVARLKEAISNANGNKAFKLKANDCKFTRFLYRDEKEIDFFYDVERALSRIRASLELDDISTNEFKSSRKGYDNNYMDLFSRNMTAYTINLYRELQDIAAAYNVSMPKFDKDIRLLSTESADDMFNSWYQEKRAHSFRKISDKVYNDAHKKFNDKYEKNSAKIKKARAAFRNTDLYKDLIEILDLVEADLKAADSNYIMWADKMAEKAKKDEHEQQIQDAMKIVANYVESKINKEFSSGRAFCYGQTNLYRLAAIAYVEDGDMPTINVKESRTGSWLAGMHHYVTFEVIGKSGKSFGEIKMEDNGLDGPDGRPVDGFGPWD